MRKQIYNAGAIVGVLALGWMIYSVYTVFAGMHKKGSVQNAAELPILGQEVRVLAPEGPMHFWLYDLRGLGRYTLVVSGTTTRKNVELFAETNHLEVQEEQDLAGKPAFWIRQSDLNDRDIFVDFSKNAKYIWGRNPRLGDVQIEFEETGAKDHFTAEFYK
jgi:hypothetical protein